MTVDHGYKSVLSAIFSRKGGSCQTTRLWDEWEDQIRVQALDGISLESGELPVILVEKKEIDRLILTTRHLVIGCSAIELSQIADIRPVSFAEKRKDELSEMDIDLSDGRKIRITIDSGPSFFAFWSVLLHVVKKNAAGP
jgi:hypothetical protein